MGGFSAGPARRSLVFSTGVGAMFVLGLLVVSSVGCRESSTGDDASSRTTSSGSQLPEVKPRNGPGDELGLRIVSPPDGALFPPEIAAPTFQWKPTTEAADTWLVRITFPDGDEPITAVSSSMEWTPSDEQWEAIKSRSRESRADVTIRGVHHFAPDKVLAEQSISIGTSGDEVGAPIFYREVHLPFLEAAKDPATYIRWRFGDISLSEQPPVILEGLPNCANCHSFSADGSILAMEVDSANDKGSYVIAPVEEEMVLNKSNIMTWSDYERDEEEPTFGLLAQISPDGRYVICMVKDRSVFVPRPSLDFSQLFFPIKGILVVYDRQTEQFSPLPGADDPKFVQANPAWSPDGKYIVFARQEAYDLKNLRNKRALFLSPDECSEFLEGGKLFRYDLYRIPFDGGKGGKPEPLEGASGNGVSNYFPKYSPDGKWIVFCRARSFMLLQPDSELYIMPASGGEARKLKANTARMNSWHSWSPNGKWLVFSSKANSAYTQLFLTHIDQEGRSSPAVVLSRFTAPNTAANIPEFVNAKPDAIKQIRGEFLDDRSYTRAGYIQLVLGDIAGAERTYRKALKFNPENANAHFNLATVLIEKRRLDEATFHCHEALRIAPEAFEAHLNLGRILVDTDKVDEGIQHLKEALRLRPEHGLAWCHLGIALEKQDKLAPAARYYAAAVKTDPDLAPALLSLASIRATAPDDELRGGDEAVELAQKACELTRYADPVALDVLAAALAETGRFSDALRVAGMAVQCARAGGNEKRAVAAQRRSEFYSRNEPFRRSAPFDP